MRIFLRTTLITMALVFSALMVWSFARNANTARSAQAAPATFIPPNCVSPMLAGLQDQESRTTGAEGRKALHDKEQAEINGELQCVASLTAYPPAPKPKNAGVLLAMPTALPGPTATLQVGIQNGIYVSYSADPFVPTRNSNNLWAGIVNGKAIQVYAGSLRDDNWQDHPNLPRQGVLKVTINDRWSGKLNPTPTRDGEVHFIAACGTKLILQAKDGTTFTFDAATFSYVNNAPACPTVTP